MKNDTGHRKALVKTGCIAGIAVVVMYIAPKLLPFPDFLSTALFIYQGPLVVVTFVGLFPFLSKPVTSVPIILGTVFGIIAGVCRMMFSVVQLTNLSYIRGYKAGAESAEEEQIWQNILNGVFTVQNGISYVMDFFLDWSVLLFGIAMWAHPKFGKGFTLLAILAAGPHFVMKAYTFPRPPAEAGLFDAGPLVSGWAALVAVWVLINVSWMDEPASNEAV